MPVNLLHIDTSSSIAKVLISTDGVCQGLSSIENSHQQAAMINTAIEEAIAAAGLTHINEIHGVSVCNGPGSYTGLRVGLSTAKGICFALNIPLVLHHKILMAYNDLSSTEGHSIIALKARSGEFYAYEKSLKAPQHFLSDDFEAFLVDKANQTLITDDPSYSSFNGTTLYIEFYTPNQKSWCATAYNRFLKKDFDNLVYSEPFYMKPAYVTKSTKNILKPKQ